MELPITRDVGVMLGHIGVPVEVGDCCVKGIVRAPSAELLESERGILTADSVVVTMETRDDLKPGVVIRAGTDRREYRVRKVLKIREGAYSHVLCGDK